MWDYLGLFILFNWSMCLFSCQYNTDLVTIALSYSLKSRCMIPLILFFFLKTALLVKVFVIPYKFSLVTKARWLRGVPYVGFKFLPIVIRLKLLQTHRWTASIALATNMVMVGAGPPPIAREALPWLLWMCWCERTGSFKRGASTI